MKLTESMLRKIIKEEVQAAIEEDNFPSDALMAQTKKDDAAFLAQLAQKERQLYALMDKLSKANHAQAKTPVAKKKAIKFSKAVQAFLDTTKQAGAAVEKLPD